MSSTTQSEVAKALTTAIQTIAESNAQSKEATLTIEAEIVDIIDEGLGTYMVSYLGNKFEASTTHGEVVYSVGDKVYVIVPNGNFDKNKIILSPVVPYTATYASTDTKNTYITLGDNIFMKVPDVNLCTYRPHDATLVDHVDTKGFAVLFKGALADSRTFNFTCKIQTNIDKSRRSRGNYGLALYIPVTRTIDDVETHEYYMVIADTNNILGDPYNLAVPALQNFYFTLPTDMEYYDDEENFPVKICSFVRNFLGQDDTKPDDIFITDIQLLSTFEVANEQMTGYYSVITASGGSSFLTNVTGDTKTLSVTAYLNGKVTKVDRFECYWFKENASITNTSEKFQRFGGLGWEILNEVSKQDTSDDGTVSVQYVTNVYTQEVSQVEIHCDTRFKCVLVSDSAEIVSTITIKNLGSDAKIKLISLSGSNLFAEDVGDVDLQLSYHEAGITDVAVPENFNIGYAWQRLDKNGQFIDNDFLSIDEYKREDNTYYLTGHYPVSLINRTNTIACTVYIDRIFNKGEEDEYIQRQTIGTVYLTVSTVEVASGGRIMIVNGDKLYKYDADGDSPLVADYDGPVSSKIKTIDPLTLNIYKEDGTELTAHEYQVITVEWLIPNNSMITVTGGSTDKNPGYTTVTQSHYRKDQYSLPYSISPRYNKNKQDNNVIVKVTAPSSVFKEPLTAVANIRFLKDGESGTNGSKYSAIVTYNNYGYGEKDAEGKVHKLQLIYAQNGWYFYDAGNPDPKDSVQLGIKLYSDGDPVSVPSTINWKIFDAGHNYDNIVSPVNVTQQSGLLTHISSAWDLKNDKNYCATIEVAVPAIREGSDGTGSVTKKAEYVYAYYPIECTYSPYLFDGSDLPRLEGGFSKVLYATDGTNPQYDNSENFYAINSIYNYDDGEDIYDYEWSVNSNLKIQSKTAIEHTCKITPKSKFDNGVSKNFVRVKLTRSAGVKADIEGKIASLISEIAREENRKEYYEEMQDLLAIFKNFRYNDYIDRLTKASEFYLEKTKLAQTATEMEKQAIQIAKACQRYITINMDDYGEVVVVVQGGSNTQDNNVYRLYLEIWGDGGGNPGKLSKLVKLANLTGKLGTSEESIDDILAVSLSSLLIENKMPMRDGYPVRSCYFTLNEMVDNYNSLVNTVYANYLNVLRDPKMSYYNGEVQRIIQDLTDYVSGVSALAAYSVGGCHEEQYKYAPLVNILNSRLFAASKLDASSYSLMIDNVINPMKDDISKYVTFTKKGGYTDTIQEIVNTEAKLNAEKAMYERMLTPEDATYVIHIKPIIMTYNRYGMSNINGWDGNKVEVKEGYILSPQVGAGKKESDNSFTGVVIGIQQASEKSTNNKIGLFGYSKGRQSIFLNADTGSATFGLSGGGQVIIDPSDGRALLKSGDYKYHPGYEDGKGMQIDLSTPEIKFGSGNFEVSPEGHITAKGGGSIAGWQITDNQLYSNVTQSNGRITLDSSGIGKIFSHSHDTLTDTSNGFYLSYDGLSIGKTIRISSGDGGKVEVGRLGSDKHWTISGVASSQTVEGYSYIGYNADKFGARYDPTDPNGPWIIDENISTSAVYLGTNGIRLDKKFFVDRNGHMLANDIILEGGVIGGWRIDGKTLVGEGSGDQYIKLDATGSIEANYKPNENIGWKIEKNGHAHFCKGDIGGWSITDKALSAKGISIDAETGVIRGEGGVGEQHNSWSIDSQGKANFSHITANSGGSIGGWTINSDGLSSSNFTLGTNLLEFLASGINITYTIQGEAKKRPMDTYVSDLTVDTLRVADLNADRITTGTLSVNRLNMDAIGSALSGYVVSCTTLQCQSFKLRQTEYDIVRLDLPNGHSYDVIGRLIN